MKKHSIVAMAVLGAAMCNAQEVEQKPLAPKMNIIKTNVTGYIFRNINLSYERSINRWFALNVGFGTVPEGKVPFMDSFLKEGDRARLEDVRVKASNFTIEPRFYVGKGYGKGFYVAPYYRYSTVTSNTFDYIYDYTAPNNVTYEIPLKGSGTADGNSGGIMVGAQFFLNKKQNFVLDFWIAGAHYGQGKGDFTMTSDLVLTPEMQAQLKSELEKMDIPYVDYTVRTNANGAIIDVDGPWAGVRSGLSLGYRF